MSQTKAELIQTVKEGTVSLGDADSSHSIKLKAPATVAADRTWTMPAVDPTANQVLTADGSTPTTLTWADAAGGVDGIVSNANATAMTVDVNENIGIQTTTPQYKFEVDTTATEKTSVGFSANGESADIRFRSNNVNEAAVIRVDESGGGGLLRFHNKNGSGTLTQNLEIETDGDVKVNTGNLIIGTSGKGIDFSATNPGNSQTSHAELLDDYEEGVFTVTCDNSVTLSQNEMRYTKIGNLVNVSGMITVNSDNSQSTFRPNNFPFNNVGSGFKDLSTFSMQTENWDLHADHKGFGGYVENAKLYIRETKDNASPGGIAADSGASMLINVTYRTND